MNTPLEPLLPSKRTIQLYYVTALLSLVFAVVGFSYNAWRLEQSEENSNIRSAAFQVLSEVSAFEQVLYASHYDQNPIEGSPRRGGVKIGLIDDLSMLIGKNVALSTAKLKAQWSEKWPQVPEDKAAVQALVETIDEVRTAVKAKLKELE